jgi:hypothetical protein
MGDVLYAALQPHERSVADALTEGACWSPEYYAQWRERHASDGGADNNASAELAAATIRELILGKVKRTADEICRIDEAGARFRRAHITGDLDLTAVVFSKPLVFEDCTFDGDVILDDAKFGHVSFKLCKIAKRVKAESVRIASEFIFENSRCEALRFKSAHIVGSAWLERAILVGDPDDSEHRTVDFADAKIDGPFSIRWADIVGEVRLVGVSIATNLLCVGAQITAQGAKNRTLYCCFATIGGAVYVSDEFRAIGDFYVQNSKVGANVQGENGRFDGVVHFTGSEIAGSLFLDGAELKGRAVDAGKAETMRALSCWNTAIGANVFIRNATVIGEANFDMAKIGSSIRATGTTFSNPKSKSLNCSSATIGFSVFLDEAVTEGQVDFVHAKIGGRLVCAGGTFDYAGYREGEKPRALNFDGAQIAGGVFLDMVPKTDSTPEKLFTARGAVYFHGATIGGDLVCRGGRFINLNGASLVLSSAEIGGSIYLSKGFLSIGEIYGRSVKVLGNFHCRGGHFHDGLTDASTATEHDVRDAVDLERAEIAGCLFLTGIRRFRGRMDLQGASAGTFADDTSVWRSNWSKDVTCPAESEDWQPKDLPASFHVDEKLLHGKKGLHHWRLSRLWRARIRRDFECIQLDRFMFQAFIDDDRVADDDGRPDESTETGVKTDTMWQARYALLQRQPPKWLHRDFRPQPFTQCAKVLREMGNTSSARNILYRRERGNLRHKKVGVLLYCTRKIGLGLFAGYGYRKRRALVAMLVLWAAGVVIFGNAFVNGQMRVDSDAVIASDSYARNPKGGPKDYEPFEPLIYSLDVMLPVIDLSQKHFWIPRDATETNGDRGHLRQLPIYKGLARRFDCFARWIDTAEYRLRANNGWLPKIWYWFETLMGWFLTTILIAALTGLLGNPRED